VRGQFLAELTEARAAQVKDLAELNRLFTVVSAVDVFGCHDVAIA